jgi:phage tail sheath protein FI
MRANFDYPGVLVTEAIRGAIPIDQVGFRSMFLVGTARRGPLIPTLITKIDDYHAIFGARSDSSYLDDAVKAILENVQNIPIYIQRVAGAAAAEATVTLQDAGTPQMITATVVGTIGASGAGNATVIVTSAGMSGSPITLSVAVANNDSASQVATKIRAALNGNATIAARFTIGGTGANITLTRVVAAANDGTLNVSIDNGTCTGLTAAPTSTNTTPGVARADVLQIDAIGPGTDVNYVASPAAGLSVTYVDTDLKLYDAGVLVETYRDVTFSNYLQKVDEINRGSQRIQVTWILTTADPAEYSAAEGLLGGTNGGSITASTYIGDESASPKTGVYGFARKDLPNGFIMCPGISDQALHEALIDVAERFRKLALLDSTFGITTAAAITERNLVSSSHGYACYIYQWCKTRDIDTNADKWVPRSPWVAALIARSHFQPFGIANVGAGLEYNLRGALAIEQPLMDDATQGELNRKGVHCARDFSMFGQGIVNWAARTISTNPLFRFLQVRVILNVVAQSIENGLRAYVFRPIDGQGRTAAEVKASIEGLLHPLWKEGTLFGTNPEDAYKVVVDLNNRVDLEAGILNVDVYIKPTPVAERINVTLFRVPLNYNMKTGETTFYDAEYVANAA